MSRPEDTNPEVRKQRNDINDPTVQRQRAALTLFANVMDAQSLTGEEREAKIDESVKLIFDTPGFDDFFDMLLLEDLEEEPEIMQEAREAMLFAADPFTGVISDDHVFADKIQGLIATSPELQQYREELLADARAADDTRWAALAEGARHRIGQRMQQVLRRPVLGTWGVDPKADPVPAQQGHVVSNGMRSRALDDVPRAAVRSQPFNATESKYEVKYLDDPKGVYRLGELRFLEKPGLLRIALSVYKIGTLEPLVESRDQWQIFPALDDRELPTRPSPVTPDTWEIADLVSIADVTRLTYDIALLPVDEQDA